MFDMSILFFTLTHAPKNNNCSRVKNGKVGCNRSLPNKNEKIIIYIPKIIKYNIPSIYKKTLNILNMLIPDYLKFWRLYNDLL